jgi:hypothetical protein
MSIGSLPIVVFASVFAMMCSPLGRTQFAPAAKIEQNDCFYGGDR